MAASKTLTPVERTERAINAARARTRPDYLVRKVIEAAPDHDVEEWAASVAASLPPLTPAEAAAIGKLAAALDSRRAEDGER